MTTTVRVRPHQRADREPCSVDGCEKKLYARGVCTMHYSRLRNQGDLGAAEPLIAAVGSGHITKSGYIVIRDVDHPLATAQGKVRLNRAVLYTKLGAGSHPCHWCGVVLPWRGMPGQRINADHVDGNKLNNDPSNLVADCMNCNTKRGPA